MEGRGPGGGGGVPVWKSNSVTCFNVDAAKQHRRITHSMCWRAYQRALTLEAALQKQQHSQALAWGCSVPFYAVYAADQ
jgi:hypothetical protein